MSTPEAPSTRAWCVLVITANRFLVRPWTSHSSQSGFERSSCWEKTLAAILRSWSSEPGEGSAEWRTWYSRLKVGSSIQKGRPVCAGGIGELLPEARDQVQAAVDVLEQVLVAGWRPLEDHDRAYVHVARRALVGQERDVDRAEAIQVPLCHATTLTRAARRAKVRDCRAPRR